DYHQNVGKILATKLQETKEFVRSLKEGDNLDRFKIAKLIENVVTVETLPQIITEAQQKPHSSSSTKTFSRTFGRAVGSLRRKPYTFSEFPTGRGAEEANSRPPVTEQTFKNPAVSTNEGEAKAATWNGRTAPEAVSGTKQHSASFSEGAAPKKRTIK